MILAWADVTINSFAITNLNTFNKQADIKKKVDELRKYHDKVKNEQSDKKKKGGPKLSQYSRWFTKYATNSLELPGTAYIFP